MTPLFKKLNFRDQPEILVLNCPASFEKELEQMAESTVVTKQAPKKARVSFAIIFATTQKELDTFIPLLLPILEEEAVLWFSYPKGTSRKYKCDFNRDTGWHLLRTAGYDTVRAVAVDDDWSALRFRQEKFIKR